MDYLNPYELLQALIGSGSTRAHLPVGQTLVRAMLSGALLGIATSLSYTATAQGLPPIVGALIFPVGFIMIVLMNLDLVTGSFAIVPLALSGHKASIGLVLRSITLAYVGNLIGSLIYAWLYSRVMTQFHHAAPAGAALILNAAAEAKTNAYSKIGSAGLAESFVKGVLCNWMVCMAAVLGAGSKSTIGKAFGAYLPIFTFFAQGYEHSVVNMFVIPCGIMMGARVSVHDWWYWNQIPVTLGNIVGALVFVTIPLFYAYGKPVAAPLPAPAVQP